MLKAETRHETFQPRAILIYYVLDQNFVKYAIFSLEPLNCKINPMCFCYITLISLFKISSKDNPNN